MKIPVDYHDTNVCIIGLGYVGLTLAVALAESGFRIMGIEKSEAIAGQIASGRAHFHETGLDTRLLAQISSGRFSVATTLEGVDKPTVFIVTVGTPLVHGEKKTQLANITEVAKDIAKVLKSNDLVILRSTVRIGVSRDVVKRELDKAGVPYQLSFCPERTLEGRALEELRSLPQIVGGIDEGSTLRAALLFSFLTPTIVKVSSLETAELVKLVNNTQRDLNFAFANEVAHICDSVGVNAREAIRAANMGYPRSSVPMPGPVGGPCLEKDPYILAEGVTMRGGETPLSLAGRELNENLIRITADRVAGYLKRRGDVLNPVITVFGLAFKGRPETSDLRGSMAIPLVRELRKLVPGATIRGYDPAVFRTEAAALGIVILNDEVEAFSNSDVCIFQTNHPSFEKISLTSAANIMRRGALLYDLWNQFELSGELLPNAVKYAGLGNWAALGSDGTGGGYR
jgi:nucleotide sugar dehydrogenase